MKNQVIKNIKTIIVDDHALLREGLAKLLQSTHRFEIIGQSENGENAIQLVKSLNPDFLLLDINLPDIDGINVLKKIREFNKSVKILMLTMHDSEKIIIDAISFGANGYCLKDSTFDNLLLTINQVLSKEEFFEKKIIDKIISFHKNSTIEKNDSGSDILSKRELQIIDLVAKGYKSKIIADKLFISYSTVLTHRRNILKKLKLKNFSDVITKVYEVNSLRNNT